MGPNSSNIRMPIAFVSRLCKPFQTKGNKACHVGNNSLKMPQDMHKIGSGHNIPRRRHYPQLPWSNQSQLLVFRHDPAAKRLTWKLCPNVPKHSLFTYQTETSQEWFSPCPPWLWTSFKIFQRHSPMFSFTRHFLMLFGRFSYLQQQWVLGIFAETLRHEQLHRMQPKRCLEDVTKWFHTKNREDRKLKICATSSQILFSFGWVFLRTHAWRLPLPQFEAPQGLFCQTQLRENIERQHTITKNAST